MPLQFNFFHFNLERCLSQLHTCTFFVHIGSCRMAMKGEVIVDLVMTMFKKLIKTKVIVKRNVNYMLNFIYSYDIPQRNERYQRRSLESDKKTRRHRKHRNDTRDCDTNGGGSLRIKEFGVGQKKVGFLFIILL